MQTEIHAQYAALRKLGALPMHCKIHRKEALVLEAFSAFTEAYYCAVCGESRLLTIPIPGQSAFIGYVRPRFY